MTADRKKIKTRNLAIGGEFIFIKPSLETGVPLHEGAAGGFLFL
jgi:hypothetical protein